MKECSKCKGRLMKVGFIVDGNITQDKYECIECNNIEVA